MESKLYYECHVTIEPVFDENLERLKLIAKSHKFQVADLLMQKRAEDTAVRSKDDTFCTGHGKNFDDLANRMVGLILELQRCGFQVWRYKIEDTVMDSKINDQLALL